MNSFEYRREEERERDLPRLLLIGAYGQLGSECREIFAPYFDLVCLGSGDLDLRFPDEVERAVLDCHPDVIINAAAHTGVDACEEEVEKAFLINAESPARMALAARRTGALLVQVSTDYVFPGDRRPPRGYSETDAVGPVSVYGRSKLEGERAIAGSGCEFQVVRTAWLYGRCGRNFLKTMLRLALQDPSRELRVVADQFGSPTWSRTLAQQLLRLVRSDSRGIFHAVGEGYTNWYELARRFLTLMEVKHQLKPCATEDYPTPARRPANSILYNRRLGEAGLLLMRPWERDLENFVAACRLELIEEVQNLRS